MRETKETTAVTDWAARTETSRRSVFGNYGAKVSVVEEKDVGGSSEVAFPLTPALSPRERENRSPAHEKPEIADSFTSPEQTTSGRKLFPLPEGEGKRNNLTLQSAIDQAIARSFVYRFIAKCFEDPTAETWSTLTDPALQNTFRAAVGVLTIQQDSGEKLLTELVPAGLEAFTDTYLVTFGHAARGSCPMNEIEYGNLKADALFQPHRLADLSAFYRAFGLEVADDASERPDHICLELEFMSVLAAKEAYALEHQLDADQLAAGREAQKKFLREHLGHWVPAFTRRLEREAGPGALATLAEFTREFVLSECVRLSVKAGSEDLLLRTVDEAAENLCASCGISNLPPGALTAT